MVTYYGERNADKQSDEQISGNHSSRNTQEAWYPGGDTLAFEVVNDAVRLRRVTPLDIRYAQALAGTLSEWSSDNDAEACREL